MPASRFQAVYRNYRRSESLKRDPLSEKQELVVPDREFMPDDDTVVLYHFSEGKEKVTEDASKFKNDETLEGGAKFVKSEAPIKPASVEPRGKLTTMWAQVRADL